MNTEQVVEMIDAITAGRPWGTEIGGLTVGSNSELFGLAGYVDITEPQQAREIAGALVAWANRKEGAKVGFSEELAVTDPTWREEWYRRNVNNMNSETRQRHIHDLKGILTRETLTEVEQTDTKRAIEILETA